jgi:hypothetical protein
MAERHVVAYVQDKDNVTMHETGAHPGYANTVHRAVIRANEQLTVVIWWRERLKPAEEDKHNTLIVESIKKDFVQR